MWEKKKYKLYACRDCDEEFLTVPRKDSVKGKRVFCPLCGENEYTDFLMELWHTPFQAHRPWTKDEDELILVGRENNYTYEQIAQSLDGRTAKATLRRAQRLIKLGLYTGRGAAQQPWTIGEDAQIRAGRAAGLPYSKIAVAFKGRRSEQAVRSRGTRLNKKEAGKHDEKRAVI